MEAILFLLAIGVFVGVFVLPVVIAVNLSNFRREHEAGLKSLRHWQLAASVFLRSDNKLVEAFGSLLRETLATSCQWHPALSVFYRFRLRSRPINFLVVPIPL